MSKKSRTRVRQASVPACTAAVVIPAGRPSTATRVRQFFGGSAPVATLTISKPISLDRELDLTPSSFTPPSSTTSPRQHLSDPVELRGRPQFFIGTPPPSPPADGPAPAPRAQPLAAQVPQGQLELGSPLALTTAAIAPRVRPRARRAPPPPIKIPTKQSIELQEAVLRTQAAEVEVGLFGIGIGIGLEGGVGGKGGGTPIAVDGFFSTPPIKSRTALGRSAFARSLNSSTASNESASAASPTSVASSPEREARLAALAALIASQNLLLPTDPLATTVTASMLSPALLSPGHLTVPSPFSPHFPSFQPHHHQGSGQLLSLPPLSPMAALSPLSIGADAPAAPCPSDHSNDTWEFKSWLTPSPLLEVDFNLPANLVESPRTAEGRLDVSALVDSFERRTKLSQDAAAAGGQRSIPTSPFSTIAFAHTPFPPTTTTAASTFSLSVPPTPTHPHPLLCPKPSPARDSLLVSRERSESGLTTWSQSTGYSPVQKGGGPTFPGDHATPEMESGADMGGSESEGDEEVATPDGTPVKAKLPEAGMGARAKENKYKRMGVMFGGKGEMELLFSNASEEREEERGLEVVQEGYF